MIEDTDVLDSVIRDYLFERTPSGGYKRKIVCSSPRGIRICQAWLDAQERTEEKQPKKSLELAKRQIWDQIERWSKQLVTTDDIKIAAKLLGLTGKFPMYNLSSKRTLPSLKRLESIPDQRGDVLYAVLENQYTYKETDIGQRESLNKEP